jgi:hypothetical protein
MCSARQTGKTRFSPFAPRGDVPPSATFDEKSCSSFEGTEERSMLLKATRGPSHLRLAESQRAGAIEIPVRTEFVTGFADRQDDDQGNAVLRLLSRWRAPVLSDEEVDALARVFLMKPGHEFVPFFLWIDDAMRAVAQRRVS